MQSLTSFNLRQWIDAHRSELRPPVCNKQVFEQGEFIIMVVGGPNARQDYHDDPGEEFFYQLEGDMLLRTVQHGRRVDIPIREGDVLLLPAHVPHSPQRFADTVGTGRRAQAPRRRSRRIPLVLRTLRRAPVQRIPADHRHRDPAAARLRAVLVESRAHDLPRLRQRTEEVTA